MNTNENLAANPSNVSEIVKGKPGRKPGSVVAKVFKPSLSFSRKFADGSKIEVVTETAPIKIAGIAPITVGIYKIDSKGDIIDADEKKVFGAGNEEKTSEIFGKFVSAVIAGTYKFPNEPGELENIVAEFK